MGRFTAAIALGFLVAGTAWASDCSRTSVGFTPLTELGAGLYQGMTGGLYPGGANKRPPAHQAAGLRLAAEVVPRDAAGAVDRQNGKIVLLSVGMSNTTQEFQVFKSTADRDPLKNPQLVIVDGAQGGWSADRIVAGGDPYWRTVDDRLRAAGLTAAQVQVAWMKQADAGPKASFPEDARRLERELQTLAQSLRARFPNLRLLYLSSRIYGGYASTALNPEPYAYQSGFAVKWLIERQIQGDPELSFETGRTPWMAWGPYLWADGTRMRSDGLLWNCSDLQDDGTHPALTARQKVSAMLLDFLKTDAPARPWFLRAPERPPAVPRAVSLVHAASYVPAVAPGSIATLFGADLATTPAWASTLPLPLILDGAMVEIDGVACPLYYVSPTQINLLAPRAAGGNEIVVQKVGARSEPLKITLSAAAPGLFTFTFEPGGPAAAIHAGGRPISAQDPARRGESIMLFATGLGPTPQPLVRIGGLNAAVSYAGPAPGFPGLDQINVTVPADAPPGTAVRIDLQVGSVSANPATLAIGAA